VIWVNPNQRSDNNQSVRFADVSGNFINGYPGDQAIWFLGSNASGYELKAIGKHDHERARRCVDRELGGASDGGCESHRWVKNGIGSVLTTLGTTNNLTLNLTGNFLIASNVTGVFLGGTNVAVNARGNSFETDGAGWTAMTARGVKRAFFTDNRFNALNGGIAASVQQDASSNHVGTFAWSRNNIILGGTKSFTTSQIDLPLNLDSVIDVTQPPWNADRTGATSASASIQAAVNSAAGKSNAVIYFPEGIYNNTATITTPTPIWLVGDGAQIKGSAPVHFEIGPSGLSGGHEGWWRVTGFSFTAGTTAVTNAIKVNNFITKAQIDHCHFKSVFTTAGATEIWFDGNNWFGEVSHCWFRPAGSTGSRCISMTKDTSRGNSSALKIFANFFGGIADDPALDLSGATMNIVNNTIEGRPQLIWLWDNGTGQWSHSANIQGNICELVGNGARTNDAVIVLTGKIKGLSINDNRLSLNNRTNAFSNPSGVMLRVADTNTTIEGSTVRGNRLFYFTNQYAIYLNATNPKTNLFSGGNMYQSDYIFQNDTLRAVPQLDNIGAFLREPGTIIVTEADGSPSVVASTIKFPNGSVTDNADGSASISGTGGSGDDVSVDGSATVNPNFDDGGDINFTYSSPNITGAVKNNTVTYAKMQDVSATQRVLGRNTAGAGDPEEVTFSQFLDWIGSAAQGDILFRGATTWSRLGAGTSGNFLQTQGAGANPIWAPGGSGDSVQVNGANATDANLKDGFQLEWFLNTTPNPDEITGRINPAAVITNATEIGREIYLGTATNVVIDPLNKHYSWAPAGNANCRFQFGTNTISATNYSPVIYIKIEGAAGQQWTNVVDTWTALGNVGVLKAGLNTIRASWDAGRWFFSQETAQLAAAQIGTGNVDDTEFDALNNVVAPIFSAGTKTDVLQAAEFAADAGANDTYTATYSPAITAYVTGARYRFKANTANTGAATININSVGAKTIKKAAGGITTDLADNDIRAGQWVELVYDGTNMQMVSLLGNAPAGSGTVTSVGWTGGLVSVATPTSTPAFTVAGTSGGIPYFDSASSWASSAALAANSLVKGGGAGVAPSTITTGSGVITALGVAVNTAGGFSPIDGTATLSNKRITPRITSITSSATPTVNTDNADCVTITALAAAITSMTTNLSGTPNNFDQLEFRIKDDGTARAITWGASFVAGPTALPTTTVVNKALHVWFEYDSVQAKWVCMSSGSDA
jgi:hypothetical protein